MCGIVAYIGHRQAYPILMKGLYRLEYRGYDSAGVALLNGELSVYKKAGKVSELEEHLRGKDFLDTASFPTAKFESTGVKIDGDKATVTGNLTLHGVTKEIEIDATRVGGGEDPWGGQRQGFTGTTTLPLKDFGINYNLGPSATAVELALEIEGVRK